MKCRMCAQTRPFDKVTIFLTQQCPAADQTNWMMRIQQLKSERGVEQQGRVGDTQNLLGPQTNTPRPKEKNQDATTRRPIKVGSESRGSNLRLTKRELMRRTIRAKMHNIKDLRETGTFTGQRWRLKSSIQFCPSFQVCQNKPQKSRGRGRCSGLCERIELLCWGSAVCRASPGSGSRCAPEAPGAAFWPGSSTMHGTDAMHHHEQSHEILHSEIPSEASILLLRISAPTGPDAS